MLQEVWSYGQLCCSKYPLAQIDSINTEDGSTSKSLTILHWNIETQRFRELIFGRSSYANNKDMVEDNR